MGEEDKALTEEGKAPAQDGRALAEEGKAPAEEGKALAEEGRAPAEAAQQRDDAGFSKPFQHKALGWIFLNGNVSKEEDLVRMCRNQILEPQNFDPAVNETKKVLLVTAAFEKGHEHHDRHLIDVFERLSIDARWENDFPRNIQNLSVWTMFNTFKERERWLHKKYTEKQDMLKAMKQDYLLKNSHYVETAHRTAKELGRTYPNLTMFEFYSIDKFKDNQGMFMLGVSDKELADRKLKDLECLSRNPLDLDLCKELKEVVDHIVYKDEEILAQCKHLEDYFLEKSGVTRSSLYIEQRNDLRERILSSATIFIFGGRTYVLVNRIRFYRLDEFFKEALGKGSNLYGISAGTLCQMDKFYFNLERFSAGGYLRAADRGMGLVEGLYVTPHAEDYAYIREAHPDALSFFSLRQRNGVMVGLSEKSVLLYERYRDPLDGNIYKRYTSIGDEPVLIFGIRGIKHEMKKDSQIIIEGTKYFEGTNLIGDKEDMEELERRYRANRATS